MIQPDTLEVRVRSVTYEAQGIHSFELRPLPGHELPPFDAGAHVDLHLPNGLIRSYSLVNPPGDRGRYVIAVNKDAASRGGSRFMHDAVKVGDVITIGAPRNNFPLFEDAPHSILIAGGIGITPLWCMVQRLQELGRSWELHYGSRNRQCTAFLDELRALGDRVHLNLHFNFDQESGGQLLDIGAIVRNAAPAAHLYCCGPLPMLAAFEQACASHDPATVHVEYFAAKEPPAAAGGFTVVLARSGRSMLVPPGKTILDTLLDGGLDVPYSCLEGICGTCETKVIDGTPDHRDLVLSKAEQEDNQVMMICCSGCKGERLTLDL